VQLTPLSTHWAPRKKNIKKGTIFFGQGVFAPMDQEILKVFFYDVRRAVVMYFSAWSAVY